MSNFISPLDKRLEENQGTVKRDQGRKWFHEPKKNWRRLKISCVNSLLISVGLT